MANDCPHWHTLAVADTARRLAVDPELGLSSHAVAARIEEYGANALADAAVRPLWLRFVDQFKAVLVVVLLCAAALAWAIGDIKDGAVILVVVVFNSALGFWQEYRAERTLAALKRMLPARSRVRRDGQLVEVDAAGLVPGDIVQLEAGDRVPADGRLLFARDLEVDESALTGESRAVIKSVEAMAEDEPALGDRRNLLFMNTAVCRGRAELIVTDTGMRTEMGRLAGMIDAAEDTQAPLQRQLDALGKRLAAIAGVVVVLIFLADLLRDLPWTQAAMMAVALAVAAIPEGLPAVVTVTLAIGMWRMAKTHAIVKKLSAVETLGSTTVICADKTGTLTLNQMTARAGWFRGGRFVVGGEGYRARGAILGAPAADYRSLLIAMAVCGDAAVRHEQAVGDPTEAALWVLAAKGGVDPAAERASRPRLAEIPFDSARKFMATFHRDGETVEMVVKGAPDVLLARSSFWLSADGVRGLDGAAVAVLEGENAFLADQALRVLGVARRSIPAGDFDLSGDPMVWAADWTFLGLVGLADPPRPEAKAAIRRCRDAGIQVKMITGDHKATATAIARELDLDGEVVSGAELDGLDDAILQARIDAIAVFARVTPVHKVRILRTLQAIGHVVAMTGDGVNDAPALKVADIGVAMGLSGTAVTRAAAALVLTDDDFSTIVHAVEEGRIVYDNIVKFVRFQLSTNIGAILTVLGATLLGWPAPFTAIHLLWINIIMDGPPAMTLGVEPARPGLMTERPRSPSARILSGRRLFVLAVYGVTMMAGTLLMFRHGLSSHGQPYALTLAFTTFVLFQFFNVFNARSENASVFNATFFRNAKLWSALAAVLAMQVLVVYWSPAQATFDTVALTAPDWGVSIMTAASVLLLDEARKALFPGCG